jgi:hypothetical protein
MGNIVRDRCLVTDSTDLEHLFTFSSFPVFMGTSDKPESEDVLEDMSWSISRKSGMIQLDNLIPLNILYPESHGAGEIGAIWKEHHSGFAKFLSKIGPKSVFEIGGAHGILEFEHRTHAEIPWVILEPNPHPSPQTKAKFIQGFFDQSFKFDGEFDTVVHSHLFEHVYDPMEFMRSLSAFMPQGANLVFSIPNMEVMLKRKYTNCINFEHTFLLTEPYVEFLLSSNGFEVLSKEKFREDHSLFIHAVRNSDISVRQLPTNLYQRHKGLYLDYVSYHLDLVKELNQKLSELEEPTYLFGAHVFSQYLIAFGLDTAKIGGILDNDPTKHGRRLCGTGLKVFPPSVLIGAGPVNVILKAGVYNDEIQKDIIENYSQSCTFLM